MTDWKREGKNMLNQEWIQKTEEFLQEKFEASSYLNAHPEAKAYRREHTYRVANIGKEIAEKEGFDVTEMMIACLLHDISYCEEFGENGWMEHGRRAAQIARPFLTELGMAEDRVEDICYGIAIHVDDEAGFPGERTPFAMTVGDADNIDRFDAFRIFETLSHNKFMEMTFAEKQGYLDECLAGLERLRTLPVATKAAEELWAERIDFYIAFYQKLESQLANSKRVGLQQVFTSKNIRYVKPSELLLQDFLIMVNDMEHVGSLIGRTETISEEDELQWIRSKIEENGPMFSMIEKATGEYIGNIELMDVHDGQAELGISITREKQEHGFGSEAIPAMLAYGFDELGLRRIVLKAYPHNLRAIHVYEKCGFREYARDEKDVFMEITKEP